MPEPEVEQGGGIGEVLGAAQHDNRDGPAVTGGRGRQAVPGGAGVAGLEADGARVGPQQPVDVDRVEGFVLRRGVDGDLLRSDDGPQVGVIGELRRRDHRHVIGGAEVVRLIEPAGIGEVGGFEV